MEGCDHISLVAAPVYAALLQRHWQHSHANIEPEMLSQYRALAITQAKALWLDTRDAAATDG